MKHSSQPCQDAIRALQHLWVSARWNCRQGSAQPRPPDIKFTQACFCAQTFKPRLHELLKFEPAFTADAGGLKIENVMDIELANSHDRIL